MKKIAILLSTASLLASCVSMTEPVLIRKDTYLISLNARGGFTSDGELISQTLEKARNFCTRQGLQMDVVSTDKDGTQGWTPQNNQVIFKCLSDNDPAFAKGYELPPNTIIENRNR